MRARSAANSPVSPLSPASPPPRLMWQGSCAQALVFSPPKADGNSVLHSPRASLSPPTSSITTTPRPNTPHHSQAMQRFRTSSHHGCDCCTSSENKWRHLHYIPRLVILMNSGQAALSANSSVSKSLRKQGPSEDQAAYAKHEATALCICWCAKVHQVLHSNLILISSYHSEHAGPGAAFVGGRKLIGIAHGRQSPLTPVRLRAAASPATAACNGTPPAAAAGSPAASDVSSAGRRPSAKKSSAFLFSPGCKRGARALPLHDVAPELPLPPLPLPAPPLFTAHTDPQLLPLSPEVPLRHSVQCDNAEAPCICPLLPAGLLIISPPVAAPLAANNAALHSAAVTTPICVRPSTSPQCNAELAATANAPSPLTKARHQQLMIDAQHTIEESDGEPTDSRPTSARAQASAPQTQSHGPKDHLLLPALKLQAALAQTEAAVIEPTYPLRHDVDGTQQHVVSPVIICAAVASMEHAVDAPSASAAPSAIAGGGAAMTAVPPPLLSSCAAEAAPQPLLSSATKSPQSGRGSSKNGLPKKKASCV